MENGRPIRRLDMGLTAAYLAQESRRRGYPESTIRVLLNYGFLAPWMTDEED